MGIEQQRRLDCELERSRREIDILRSSRQNREQDPSRQNSEIS